jgi:transposase
METRVTKKFYTKEFKLEAVKLVLEQALSITEASQKLGVAHSSLSRWAHDFQNNGAHSFPGKGKLLPWEQEKKEFEKRLKKAEMVNDILKKALGFFAEHKG